MPLVACFRDVAQWVGLKFGAPNTIQACDLCLRWARLSGLFRQATSGRRYKSLIGHMWGPDQSTVIDFITLDRDGTSVVFAFPGVGLNERGILWRQHTSNLAGLSRACVPQQSFRQAHFGHRENRSVFSSRMLAARRRKFNPCKYSGIGSVRLILDRSCWGGHLDAAATRGIESNLKPQIGAKHRHGVDHAKCGAHARCLRAPARS